MRSIGLFVFCCLVGPAGEAMAQTCSERAAACGRACTPDLVSSGVQHGGTVPGCRTSCADRRKTCLRDGVWVHMGASRRGERETVTKR